MPKIIIADTSCFILLDKINHLDLLQKTYGQVYTTPQIVKEFGKELPEWITVENVSDFETMKKLERELDLGGASAIALTYQLEDSVVVLDDLLARKVAERLGGVTYTGTFGVMIKAKHLGIVSSVKPLLELVRKTNFRFSETIFETTLKASGEQ